MQIVLVKILCSRNFLHFFTASIYLIFCSDGRNCSSVCQRDKVSEWGERRPTPLHLRWWTSNSIPVEILFLITTAQRILNLRSGDRNNTLTGRLCLWIRLPITSVSRHKRTTGDLQLPCDRQFSEQYSTELMQAETWTKTSFMTWGWLNAIEIIVWDEKWI